MATPRPNWFGRHRKLLVTTLVVVLVAVIGFEAFLLAQQRAINRAISVHSARLLTTFLEDEGVKTPRTEGVLIRLQNVRFKWSDRVYIDTGDMATRAVPLTGTAVNFDDLDSFVLTMQRSTVDIRPDVLEGMFNESVFNYPDSKVRDLKVTVKEKDGERLVHIKGNIDIVAWIPFEMDTRLSVDTRTNTLVMDVDKVKVLGFLPATKLIKWKPFHLDRLMTMPPNKSLLVEKNRMMVKPFGLFPPPRVTGTMQRVEVEPNVIRLTFSGSPIPAPESPGNNYVYLKGGTAQFGKFRMLDTDILIRDRNPNNTFVFSLAHYQDAIPHCDINIKSTKSVRVVMPDF